MPAWSWVVIAAVVVILVALAVIVALSKNRRKRTERLKEHFGPEYERAVGETGDQSAAEKELVARQRNRQKLDIVASGPESRARYSNTGARCRLRSSTIRRARWGCRSSRHRGNARTWIPDRRLRPARSRYLSRSPRRRRALSISQVLHLAQERGDIGTEAQREAFVHYRALFEKLLENNLETDNDRPKEARA